jgi:glycosyltransferase involved in cell wall biosynthesis
MADLCTHLNKTNKYQVDVLTYNPYDPKFVWIKKEKIGNNCTVHRYWWPVSHFYDVIEKYPLLSFLYISTGLTIYTILFLIKNPQIQVIHTQGLNAAFAGKIAKLIFKKRHIFSTHAIYNFSTRPFLGKLVKWVISDVDSVLALSHQSYTEFSQIGINKNKLNQFTYWVDQSIFRPASQAQCRHKLQMKNKFTVLFVGRFIPLKGINIVLKLAKQLSSYNFVMVGGGLMEKAVKQKSSVLANLTVYTNVANADMPAHYNAADLLIIPSLYEEGIARVMLECLSCGIPILGSDRGGIREVVDSTVGIRVKPTYYNFKQSIQRLHSTPKLYNTLKKNTLAYAHKHFSANNAAIIEKSYLS